MAERPFRLFPARGLDLTRVDDRALQGNPMRGCINFRVVGNEWWTREGEVAKRRQLAGLPGVIAVSLDLEYGSTSTRRHFLISHWGCLEIDVANSWAVSVPYSPAWTGTLTFTHGDAFAVLVATTSGTLATGSILIAPDYDGTNTAYRVVSITGVGVGARIGLDRAYAGTDAAALFVSTYATWGAFTSNDTDIHGTSFCVFRQRVTYGLGAVWSDGATTEPYATQKSPAVNAGDIFLVIAFGQPSATIRGPVAIKLNGGGGHCLFDFMRQTQSAAIPMGAGVGVFSSNSSPLFVESYKERLIVQREDENQANPDRTVWYSQPGDMFLWHTGTPGGSPAATHNVLRFTEGHDKISGMALLGDDLVVHRDRSQQLLKSNGSGVAPFTTSRNDQGLGFIASRSVVSVRGLHYGWTDYGPAVFDGQRIELMSGSIQEIAASLATTAEWVTSQTALRAVHGVYHACRQQIWWSVLKAAADWNSLGLGGSGTKGYIVLDLASGEVWTYWFQSGAFSAGIFRLTADASFPGREVVVRMTPDGTFFQSTQTEESKDDNKTYGVASDEPQAMVETAWLEMGSPNEKEIHQLEIEFRPISDGGATEDLVNDPQVTGTLRVNIYVFTDGDMTPVPTSDADGLYQAIVESSVLQTVRGLSEGSRLQPRVTDELNIRRMGTLFKFVFTNSFTQNTRAFRISQVTAWLTDESTREKERQR